MSSKVGFKVTRTFFNSADVVQAMDAQQRKLLSRVGAFVRQRAKSSIRTRKKASKPGQPPHSHGQGLLKKFLFFSYDFQQRSVVIGPMRLPKKGLAPKVLEHGGTAQITTWGKGRKRVEKTISIKPRPYMGPALAEELKGVPGVWRNLV